MNQRGGEDTLTNVIRALLEMKNILFLPNSDIVTDKTRYSDYFSSIDSKTLLYLIKENNIPESETVRLLFSGPENPNAPQIPDASLQILENINTIKPTLENTSDYTYYKQFLELNNQLQQLYSQIQKLKSNMEMYNRQLSQFQCIRGLDNLEHGFISNFIFIIPEIAVSIRRLHDINKSGWWILLTFTIIGIIPLTYFYCIKGDENNNAYGQPN